METPGIRYFRPVGIDGVELLSCPDAGFDFPPHFHDAYCIWFNTKGGEHFSQRGVTDILQPDCFGIVAPGEVHANSAIDRTDRSLMTFYVQPAHFPSSSLEFKSGFYRDPECLAALYSLFGLLQRSTAALEKESALLETFQLLAGRHAVGRLPEPAIGNEKARVASIIDIFREHLSENISLEELAQRFHCTSCHLIRSFKKERGLTPYAFLVHLRLERARELISQGRPLVEAALETGFADQSHLTRHFKALYGISPGIFKRQIRHH
jgi:AraC-like DNA-binding protein